MFSIEIDELEDRINQLKKELIQVALTTGLNSHDTLCCSQKLDELITIYQKLSYEKPKNRNMLLNDNKAV
ncbi:aspartyl-phosphate phosphatase Spo0E family protein [Bacillus sp. V3B]|nr:aspartyl-phosphate phosphatase Spo0E family protein [Bacillus sp. V3B]